MKQLSRDQLEKRKAQAVRFTRDIVGDADRADEIEDESLESYAERRKIELVNPERSVTIMASKQELLDQITELKETVEDLEGRLDDVLDIVAPVEEGEGEYEDEGEE